MAIQSERQAVLCLKDLFLLISVAGPKHGKQIVD